MQPLPALPEAVISALKNSGIVLTRTGMDMLESWLPDMDPEVIVYAVKEADMSNHRSMKYIEGVLRTLKGEGITTIAAVREREEKHHRTKRFSDRESSVYSDSDTDYSEIMRLMDEKY